MLHTSTIFEVRTVPKLFGGYSLFHVSLSCGIVTLTVDLDLWPLTF